ncbi:sigma factor-like helix-turn-helix DNA-binding protein [Clostridium sp.]|uniref:sigma factor-like helix-turn-helix DNA-binding protein n=1 Tax=Clostridium sp. TaxID=1506 RepID=UPI0025BA97DA|nr:sigma factor-like helix-turn-helix DNA-binding protein [Clostridium sp.]MCI9303926.1 sigma-70 family RNA polymerase sigma factor [Clostridium sp.]
MSKDLIFKIRNIQNNKNSKDILEILNTYEDKQLLSYLSKSLKNEYIRLSKKNDKQKNNEYYNCEDKELGFNLIESNIETLDIIDTLNDYEKNIIKLIIINGYSPAEIAKKMGKSRQAINQAKIRALNKLKNFI